MVGIIVMTHGTLSEGNVDAAELITGPVTQVETLSLRREDNVNDLNAAFLAALDRVDTGDGGPRACRPSWRKPVQRREHEPAREKLPGAVRGEPPHVHRGALA